MAYNIAPVAPNIAPVAHNITFVAHNIAPVAYNPDAIVFSHIHLRFIILTILPLQSLLLLILLTASQLYF